MFSFALGCACSDDESTVPAAESVSTHGICELLTVLESARKFKITIKAENGKVVTFRIDSEKKGERWATAIEKLHSQDQAIDRMRALLS